MRSRFVIAAGVFLFMAAPLTAWAQSASSTCPEQGNLVKAGTWKAKGTTVGFLIGVRWGTGTVTFNNGVTRKFEFKGGKVIETGAATVEYAGTVYNLKKIEDFEGTYTGLGTGITIVKGMGGTSLTNLNCVIVNGKATKSRGLRLSAPAPAGVTVRFVK